MALFPKRYIIVLSTGIICISLLLCSCNNTTTATNTSAADTAVRNTTATSTSPVPDTAGLQQRVTELYQWHEKTWDILSDFPPKQTHPSDSLYSGIDWEIHEKNVALLHSSGLFTRGFFDTYQAEAEQMDKEMSSGAVDYYVGEIGPYFDASPWCNCQDFPSGSMQLHITLENTQPENGEWSFSWKWESLEYHMKAKKENGVWKFSYLEGFRANPPHS